MGLNHDCHRAVYLSGHLDSADQIRHENRRVSVPLFPPPTTPVRNGGVHFWGFMLAMGWVLVYWTVEAVVVRIYAAQMCKQAGITVYVTPEQWRNLTKESADNLRKNAPFSLRDDSIIFNGKEFEFFHPLSEFDGIDDYIYLPKDKNYTTLYYEIYFDKRFQVILFKNLRIYTRSASPGNSYKFWIDSTPRCGNSAFDYFSEHYLISQPTVKR